MSNMEDLEPHLNERERQSQVYRDAVNEIEAKKRRNSARGYAVMAGLMSLDKGAKGHGAMGKIVHGTKLFLILFAFLAPSLLVWQVLL